MWVLSPGQRVDRYLVEAMIGAGGVAVVYRVRDTTLDTVHALKLLVTDTPSVRKRMRREGRVQFALRHPNIVKVSDVLEVEGRPALVMEYVDGPTLREWMLREDRPLVELISIFRVVARAVGFAHAHGHVHRDLKPGNVLLARSDGGLVPKVADFGIVKTVHGASVQTTQQGVFMGTPEYTAPEQIRSAGQVDHRADLFALGCILYEMACRQVPFAGKDLAGTLNAVRRGTYVEPLRLVPDLPPPVVQAIQGLLKAEPDRRIPSCDELLVALADAPGLPAGNDGSFEFVPIPLDRTWGSQASGPVVASRAPPEVHDVTPTQVPAAPHEESPHPFDDAAYSGIRALVHRLALELLTLQRGTRDPAVLGARYASAVSGVQGIRRTAEALAIPEVGALARGLVELVEGGRRDERPLDAGVVDAVLRGMDAMLLRLKAHADGRPPSRGAQREFDRAAEVVETLACSRREVEEARRTP